MSWLKRARPAVKPLADSVPVEIVLGDELELVGYRIDALPTEAGAAANLVVARCAAGHGG